MTQSPDFPAELLLANRFYFQLEVNLSGSNEVVDAVFLECQRLQQSQPAIEVVEVSPNTWAKAKQGQLVATKIPGRVTTDNIVLKRGTTHSVLLWKWFAAVEQGKWYEHLATGSLVIFDQAGAEQSRYNFQAAWPMRYSSSAMSAQSTELAIEELELAVESIERVK